MLNFNQKYLFYRLNQLLNAMIYIHLQHVTIFQGNLNTEKIFIQNNSAIKIAPSLLKLCLNNNEKETLLSAEKRTIKTILNLNDDIIDKDLYSLGLIAIQIFTSHLSLTSVVNSLNLNASNNSSANIQIIANFVKTNNYDAVKSIFSVDQFSFVFKCLNASQFNNENMMSKTTSYTAPPLSPMAASIELINKSPNRKKLKVEYLLYQPLVNEIYSLKILSVYSLLGNSIY